MTDTAYSVLLFFGLVAGSASAFIVNFNVIPFYVIFLIAGFFNNSRKGTYRVLLLITAPVFVLLLAITSGNNTLVERSLRWIAAVVAGTFMSGALGASRASELLFSASKRANPGGLPESLAMILSLAGPFSEKIRRVFIESRSNHMSIADSFAAALSSVREVGFTGRGSLSRRSMVSAFLACLAWLALLAGIVEVL